MATRLRKTQASRHAASGVYHVHAEQSAAQSCPEGHSTPPSSHPPAVWLVYAGVTAQASNCTQCIPTAARCTRIACRAARTVYSTPSFCSQGIHRRLHTPIRSCRQSFREAAHRHIAADDAKDPPAPVRAEPHSRQQYIPWHLPGPMPIATKKKKISGDSIDHGSLYLTASVGFRRLWTNGCQPRTHLQ